MQYSLLYVVPNTLSIGDLVIEELTFLRYQITERQRIGYNIPQAVFFFTGATIQCVFVFCSPLAGL